MTSRNIRICGEVEHAVKRIGSKQALKRHRIIHIHRFKQKSG